MALKGNDMYDTILKKISRYDTIRYDILRRIKKCML